MTEPPDWQPPPPGYGAPPYNAPAPYGAPPQHGYPPQPPPYGAPPAYGYAQPYGYGWPGEIRPTGKTILLVICTLGIYIFVYNYKVHDEMKRYSGRGVGGGIALLLTFVANVAMPFVTPAEVGNLYALRGERPPVNGWTGLWFLIPAVGGYIAYIVAVVAWAVGSNDTNSGAAVVGVLLLVYFACLIGGGVIWFIKTNGALNRFWESVGVAAPGTLVA